MIMLMMMMMICLHSFVFQSVTWGRVRNFWKATICADTQIPQQ